MRITHPLNVCVDIQPALAQQAGIGRYVQCLAERLGPHRGADAVRLFCFDFKRHGVPFATPDAPVTSVQWCPGRIVQRAWRTLRWPPYDWFSGPADVYHFTNFIRPPLTRGRSVVSIYDASFLRYPDAAEPKNLAYLKANVRDTVRRADAVITISEFSRREIVELLAVPEDRVYAVHPGLDHASSVPGPAQAGEAAAALGIEPPYLLTVGTLEPRKNIPFLVDVFDRLAGFEGELVVAGMRGWKYEPILEAMRRARKAGRIRYLGFTEDRYLPGLYAGAELFVFPSLYEGFGFPPLEAMRCGTAVVSSTGGSLPEALGDAARLIPGYDAEQWAAVLGDLLADADARAALAARGPPHTAQYGWDAHARHTWDVYRSVAAS